MSARPARVAIVGAGVAGAASACAFASQGLEVVVLELRDMARDPNRGDLLDGVSVSHLERWGAMEEVCRRDPVPMRSLLFANRDGALGQTPLGRRSTPTTARSGQTWSFSAPMGPPPRFARRSGSRSSATSTRSRW